MCVHYPRLWTQIVSTFTGSCSFFLSITLLPQQSKPHNCFRQYNFNCLIIIIRTDIITRTYRRSLYIGAHDDKLNLRSRVPALICSSFWSYKTDKQIMVNTVSIATKSYHPHPLHFPDIFSATRFMTFKQLFSSQRREGDEHDRAAVWKLHHILTGISMGKDLEAEFPW